MTDEVPDYTTMSGAEFKRAVGVDPEKWARACLAHGPSVSGTTPPPREASPAEQVEFLTRWFADAMAAARRDAGVRLDGE